MLKPVILALSVFLLAQSACADSKPSALAEGLAVSEVLELVNKHNQKPAHLIINLANGNSFRGIVESISTNKNVFTFKDYDSTTSIIRISEVSSLSVVDPGSAKIALQGYKIIRDKQDQVPSALALRRMIEKLQQLENLKIGASLSPQDLESLDCRYYTEKVLIALEQIRSDILKDEAGRLSAKAYQSIILKNRKDASLLVSNDKTELTLEFDCLKPLVSDYISIIEEQINKQL